MYKGIRVNFLSSVGMFLYFKRYKKRSARDREHWISYYYCKLEKFCVLPIHYDKRKRTLHLTKSRSKFLIWLFIFLYVIADNLYQISLMIRMMQPKFTVPRNEKLKSYVHGGSRLVALGLIVATVSVFKSTTQLLNAVRSFHWNMKSKFDININVTIILLTWK